jgi:hypothetical protein
VAAHLQGGGGDRDFHEEHHNSKERYGQPQGLLCSSQNLAGCRFWISPRSRNARSGRRRWRVAAPVRPWRGSTGPSLRMIRQSSESGWIGGSVRAAASWGESGVWGAGLSGEGGGWPAVRSSRPRTRTITAPLRRERIVWGVGGVSPPGSVQG